MEEEMALAEEQLRARRQEQEKRSPLGSVRWAVASGPWLGWCLPLGGSGEQPDRLSRSPCRPMI